MLVSQICSGCLFSLPWMWCVPPESQDSVALAAIQAELLPLWKKFLLNQFHDVLPGSCIEQVHIENLKYFL